MQLRTFLRQKPQPAQLRIRTADDEERTIRLSDNLRHRWTAAAQAVESARAVVVECLASDGTILRSMPIEYEGEQEVDDGEKNRKAIEKAVNARTSEMASFATAYGHQLNEAFDRGAQAANSGQDQLVNLVSVLTQHLTLAITNLHNVSVNLGNIVASAGGQEPADTNGEMLKGLLGQVLMRQMSSGGGEEPKPKSNGAQAPGGKKP